MLPPIDILSPEILDDLGEGLISRIISSAAFQLELNKALRTSISLRVNNVGVVANLPGRLEITSTKGPVGQFELHAPAGWVWHSAVGGGGSSAARFVAVDGAGSQTITVHVFSAANNPIDAQFLIQGTLQPA